MRQITAPETRKSISFIRSEIGDLDYKIYKTEDELFNKLNDSIEEICKNMLVLESVFKFDMIPDKWEYSTIELLDTTLNILQVKRAAVFDSTETELTPKMDAVSLETFHSKRRQTLYTTGENSSGDEVLVPRYYCFDGQELLIWKPFSITGYKIQLTAVREFMESDKADYDKDPPQEIVAKYIKYANYGAVARAIGPRAELQNLNIAYYEKEFEKYKTTGSIARHYENEKYEFNELNLE